MFGLTSAYAAWPIWFMVAFAFLFAVWFIIPRWSPTAAY